MTDDRHKRCECGELGDSEDARFPYPDISDGGRTHYAVIWRCPACGHRWISTPYGRVELRRVRGVDG